MLVIILKSEGRAPEAESAAREVLNRKPGWPPAQRELAALLVASGKTSDAIILFRQAVAAEPNHLEGRNGLASVLASQGQIEAALEQYAASLRIAPDQALIHGNMADLLGQTAGDVGTFDSLELIDRKSARGHVGGGE